jgi:hypothetical protein
MECDQKSSWEGEKPLRKNASGELSPMALGHAVDCGDCGAITCDDCRVPSGRKKEAARPRR